MTITSPPENVITVQLAMSFEQTLAAIRSELSPREFCIISEVDFGRELDSRAGVAASQYGVLIVWHPFSAYQAILSDPNGRLMVPFNVAVYAKGNSTVVSVPNQPVLNSEASSLGVRVLGRELNRRMRDVLLHLGTYEQRDAGRHARLVSSSRR